MTVQTPVLFRSAIALAVALLFSAPAVRAANVAVGGPCAVASDRDPCAGGACTKTSSKTRNRFNPEEVASESAHVGNAAPLPDANAFSGPGTCADPSAGCGGPRVVTSVVPSAAPTPRAPAPEAIPGPPAAPPTPAAPAPPIPAAPPVVSGGPTSTPPPPTPPTPLPPPAPPVVIEPPPGPVLPPGVPTP